MNIRCLIGNHDWSVFDPADWKTDYVFAWGICSDGKRVMGGPRVRVVCDRCGKRDHARFERLTETEAWKRGVTREWLLVVNGWPVKGGPSSAVIDRGFAIGAAGYIDRDRATGTTME